jgi:hypothetical protein
MTLVLGPFLGGLAFPLAIEDNRLDNAPVTAISSVEPGGAYKVYAAVATGQSDVINGSWTYTSNGVKNWAWTAHNFWITEGGTRLFVNVSSLIFVSQPGNPWGSESGTVAYSSGDPIAIFGSAETTPNGTTLFAQYVSSSPSSMGNRNGELWPLILGCIVGPGVAMGVGAAWSVRQRRQHREEVALHPPRLAPPHVRPSAAKGQVMRYTNTRLPTLIRKSWITTGITIPFVVLGVPLFFVNYYFGILFVCMAGTFLVVSFFNRSSYRKSPTTIYTDDDGVAIDSQSPPKFALDSYTPWSSLKGFHVYFSRTLALRTDRGEFVLNYLPDDVVSDLTSEMQGRGIPSGDGSSRSGPWLTQTIDPPLSSSAVSEGTIYSPPSTVPPRSYSLPPLETDVHPVSMPTSARRGQDYFSTPPPQLPHVFPRGLLRQGEVVLYEVRPTFWGLYGSRSVVLIVLMGFFLLPVEEPGYATNPFFFFFEGLLIAVLALLLVSWKHTAYALTDRRILAVRGRCGRPDPETLLTDLNQITLDGLGASIITFHIKANQVGRPQFGARKIRWPGVPNADAVFGHIQRTLDARHLESP